MKIYLGILSFFTGIEFYPKIEALSKDINCYPRFELSSKDIRKVHYPVWHLKRSAGAFQFWESDHLKKYIFHVILITVCFSSRQRMRTLLIAFSLQSNTKFYPVGVIGNALELCTIILVTQPFVLIHLNRRNKGRERRTGLIEIVSDFPGNICIRNLYWNDKYDVC